MTDATIQHRPLRVRIDGQRFDGTVKLGPDDGYDAPIVREIQRLTGMRGVSVISRRSLNCIEGSVIKGRHTEVGNFTLYPPTEFA